MEGNDKKSRFTLDMTPELRTRLKIAAARKGVTMREYSLLAIEQLLVREEMGVLSPGAFSSGSVDKARELQESVFGRRRLAVESSKVIRQARERRAGQL